MLTAEDRQRIAWLEAERVRLLAEVERLTEAYDAQREETGKLLADRSSLRAEVERLTAEIAEMVPRSFSVAQQEAIVSLRSEIERLSDLDEVAAYVKELEADAERLAEALRTVEHFDSPLIREALRQHEEL